ncbi:MAG: aldehyde dehydrogenase family protein [Acidobacteriota bacterium]
MTQRTISPVDGSVYAERELTTSFDALLAPPPRLSLAERIALCQALVAQFEADADAIGRELTWQMGRPLRYTPNEIRRGFAERARYMISIAEQCLADIPAPAGFIRKEPVGVVFTIAPWNYPYLCAVNSIVPAILAGNAVLLKASAQTPLVAERFAAALPPEVLRYAHLSHESVLRLVADRRIGFVSFTGSVAGGRQIEAAARAPLALELGGKDPAYVRADADLAHAVENLVDGAMFNSGQSCCGVERIYVDRAVYAEFVERAVALTSQYVLGNPLDPATTLGPLVRPAAADFVRAQVAEAIAQGAHAHLQLPDPGGAYLPPQILTNVNHSMRVMTEETFGPVVGIMPVDSEAEAVQLMNDSAYGLTASIWTRDQAAALRIGAQIDTGTVYHNRCDYLAPSLAWTGVKDSGRGVALSVLGFAQFTRPKSFLL